MALNSRLLTHPPTAAVEIWLPFLARTPSPRCSCAAASTPLASAFGCIVGIFRGILISYFPRYRLVAFVHGCFWHGHDCSRASRPRSNREYWDAKIEGNLARDHRNAGLLKQAKWEVSTIRECTLSLDTECLISQLVALRDKAERHSL